MSKYLYKCHYCGIKYLPKRRNKQKYCCNSCRVNAFNIRNRAKSKPILNLEIGSKGKTDKGEKINMAGIGNAAIANVATEFAKNIFTKEENKPATKGDLKVLLNHNRQRYLPVTNAPQRNDGTKAFYDSVTKVVVYRSIIPSFHGETFKN